MTPYPVMSDAPNIQATLPATSDMSKDPLPKKKDIPGNEETFQAFLLQGVSAYYILINQDIQMMWDHLMKGAFALTETVKTAKTNAEKLKAMRGIYKVDEQAITDFSVLGGITKFSSPSELVTAYTKAILLHEYLFRHHSTHHEAY